MPERSGGRGEKYATFTSADRREQPVDARVPRDSARDVAARSPERTRLVGVAAQRGHRAGHIRARRSDHKAGLTVAHDVEWPARVRRRHDRLLGEERLEGDEPVVLVERRVVHAEAAGIQTGEFLVRNWSGRARAAVEPAALAR